MSNLVKLKAVRCVNPVPYGQSAAITLSNTEGTLVLDEATGVIYATEKRSGKTFGISPGNYSFFEILNEAAELETAKRKQAILNTPAPAPKAAVDDTVKLTKR